ncbi:MAG: hypothetical protein RLZZ70_644 [Candidatus Parcubacteria bacterium]|jgi:CxxC-x17-CxxC domain-containing protein
MKNFQPGGLRNRREDIGGRPRGDVAQYAPKTRGDRPAFKKPFGEKRSGGFNPKDRAPRDQKAFSATCSTCGKACDVPFKPDGVKPVLCRECFANKNSATTNMTGHRDRFASNEQRGHTTGSGSPVHTPIGVSAETYALVQKQLTILEEKINQILQLVQASEKLVDNLPAITPAKADKIVKVKKVAVAKKVVAKKVVAKTVKKDARVAKKVVKKAAKKSK